MITVLPDVSPARRRMVPVPGGDIAALEFGPADRPLDILFLHANGFCASTYRSILAPLGESLRVLAIDQRGHGRSTLEATPFQNNAWTIFRDDLLAVLEVVGAPTVLSGHSMGGTACLLAAARRADAARRLVLFDPVIITPERLALMGEVGMRNSPLAQGALRRRAVFASREAAFEGWLGRGAFRTWPEESLRDYTLDGLLDDGDGVRLACAPEWESSNFASHGHDSLGAFGQSAAPIRILRAEDASTCGLGSHEAEVLATGRVTVETVPGTSHFLPMERPDLVRQALTEAAT